MYFLFLPFTFFSTVMFEVGRSSEQFGKWLNKHRDGEVNRGDNQENVGWLTSRREMSN